MYLQSHTLKYFIVFMRSWEKLGFGKHSGGAGETEMRGRT